MVTLLLNIVNDVLNECCVWFTVNAIGREVRVDLGDKESNQLVDSCRRKYTRFLIFVLLVLCSPILDNPAQIFFDCFDFISGEGMSLVEPDRIWIDEEECQQQITVIYIWSRVLYQNHYQLLSELPRRIIIFVYLLFERPQLIEIMVSDNEKK